jgi:hypothetical protein
MCHTRVARVSSRTYVAVNDGHPMIGVVIA